MTSHYTQAQSRYVEVNGQRLHYRLWSTDGPPLILLHGVTSSATSWDEIAPEFAADYCVMAFDLRGHGLSSKPAEGYSWADHYAADIVDFLRSHVNEPAVLVGHSLGAVVTAPVAATVPDRVRCVVMEDPPAFAPSEDHARTHRFEKFSVRHNTSTLMLYPYSLDIQGVVIVRRARLCAKVLRERAGYQ